MVEAQSDARTEVAYFSYNYQAFHGKWTGGKIQFTFPEKGRHVCRLINKRERLLKRWV